MYIVNITSVIWSVFKTVSHLHISDLILIYTFSCPAILYELFPFNSGKVPFSDKVQLKYNIISIFSHNPYTGNCSVNVVTSCELSICYKIIL